MFFKKIFQEKKNRVRRTPPPIIFFSLPCGDLSFFFLCSCKFIDVAYDSPRHFQRAAARHFNVFPLVSNNSELSFIPLSLTWLLI